VIRRIQAGEVHTGRRPAGAPAADAKPADEKKHLLKRPVRIPKKKPEESAPAATSAAATSTSVAPAPAASAPPSMPAVPAAASPAVSELDRLRLEQAEAVKAEDYEKAARIRDRIRALETGKEGGTKA
jgi:excinuclease UvrABC helicase subunit UvrB